MPARFQKCGEATFNYPYNNHTIGHDGRGIAVTIRRNVGHDPAKSPVTMTWNTQAFICGMFHRLGKNLSIFYFNEEFQEIERLLARQTVDEEAASTLVLGIPYSELGRAVAESWKFPEGIQRSTRHPGRGVLPRPADTAEVQQQIAAFANELCELAARSTPEQLWQRLDDFSLRFAGLIEISPDELIELLSAAFEKLGEFAPILGLDLRNSALIGKLSSLLRAVQSTQSELEQTAQTV